MSPEELRDLQERASLIGDMAAHPGWDLLLDRARVTMLSKQTRIIRGLCEDYESYVRECAFTDGMEFILTLPERTKKESLDATVEELVEE